MIFLIMVDQALFTFNCTYPSAKLALVTANSLVSQKYLTLTMYI